LGKESDGHQGKQVRVNEPEEARPGRPRSSARKSTPWIKPGDATPMDDEDEDEEEQGEKKVAISPESIKQKEQTQETICQRAKGRRATPWITPATPMDDEDEDEDDDTAAQGGAEKHAVICEDAVRAKEEADGQRNEEELAAAKRRGQRKSTPFVKVGDAQALQDDEDEDEDEDDAKDDRHAVIDPAAVSALAEAEGQRDATQEAEARRTRQRKSTPFTKPGAAAFVDEDEDDESDDNPSTEAKHVVISPEAVQLLESAQQGRDAAEEAQARRTRQRKNTPFCGGAVGHAVLDDEDEDEDEEGLGGRKVTILEDEPEYSADRVVNKRNMARKATPWLKQGDATTMDDDEDDEEGTEQRLPWYRLLCHCNGQSTAVDVSAEQKL